MPDPVQVDATAESQKAINLNMATEKNLQPTLTDLSGFFQDLFKSSLPAGDEDISNANRAYVRQLQTGYGSKEDQDFLNQQIAQGNLSHGLTPGSAIGQFNKGQIWRDKVSANQAAGFTAGQNLIQNDQQVAMSLLQPVESFLNSNLVTPSSFLSVAQSNANSQNEANTAQAIANSQNNSGLGGIVGSLLGRGLGALAGSAFGPIGTAIGGSITSGLFGSSGTGGASRSGSSSSSSLSFDDLESILNGSF